jgi:chromosome segregation ATPase
MKRPTSHYSSYQHGINSNASNSNSSNNNYQPPVFYAADQTQTLTDTTQAFHQADETAGHVLSSLQHQRHQIANAHDSAQSVKRATEHAKKELETLRMKYRERKLKLYMAISVLAILDTVLFVRIVQCRGNFFC